MSASHPFDNHKPLQVNPFKLSQPMGATLAFMGVNNCMPLMHGAQGCANFTKVFFTRHFCEPIAMQNTAVNDITAVLDGGGQGIAQAVEAIAKKVSPELIGLCSTGLTETKGDDLRAANDAISLPSVYVQTPDYEGGLESGFASATQALIEQLVESTNELNEHKALILPHASMTPLETEKIKDLLENFGFASFALPDLSTSLDGFLGEKQASLSSGGITVEQIKGLADSALIISIGASMKQSAQSLLEKNSRITHLHCPHLQGLEATDQLIAEVMKLRGMEPGDKVKRWRSRLQDVMLDSHFMIGKTRFIVTGEPDSLLGITSAIREVGGIITLAVSSVESSVLDQISAEKTLVGDMEDVEQAIDSCTALISNCHAERLAHQFHKPLIMRGFPNWEQVGNPLTHDNLYEGSAYFLKEVANALVQEASHV